MFVSEILHLKLSLKQLMDLEECRYSQMPTYVQLALISNYLSSNYPSKNTKNISAKAL